MWGPVKTVKTCNCVLGTFRLYTARAVLAGGVGILSGHPNKKLSYPQKTMPIAVNFIVTVGRAHGEHTAWTYNRFFEGESPMASRGRQPGQGS